MIARINVVGECEVIARTNVHCDSWLRQSALINGHEDSMKIHCVIIEMQKSVHE